MIFGACYFALFSWDPASAALLPPVFVDSVVALGAKQQTQEVGHPPQLEWQTVGTGFFYGYLVQDDVDVTKRRYEVYLVTAKHVVLPFILTNRDLNVRLNMKANRAESREFPISNHPERGSGTWFCHPDRSVDVAAVLINFEHLNKYGIEPGVFTSDQSAADREKLTRLDVSAGDGIFVLGFPMGLSGVQRNYVIVRQGVIARLSEMLDGASLTFLIDAFVFPGNSGGPVVLKPEMASILGTKNQPTAYLIGMVTSYRPYIDTALSQQTRRPRISFEENSGLAEVLPIDAVETAIRSKA